MLEKRTTNKSAEDVKSQTTMEDMVNLLYESNCLTKQLEEQTLFYQVFCLLNYKKKIDWLKTE